MCYIITEAKETQIKYFFQLVWIGLYDDMDSWKWSLADSSFYKHGETDFRRWLVGEPNNVGSKEHCVWMDGDGRWADDKCADRFQSICMNARGDYVN